MKLNELELWKDKRLLMNFSDSRDFERGIVKFGEWYQAERARAAPMR